MQRRRVANFDELEDRFEIGESIGRGRYGVVAKAYDRHTNTEVAIKQVMDLLSNNSECEKLYREIRFLESFKQHQNILNLVNIIKSANDKDVYLVLEYMEANLFNAIRAKILNEQHIKYITYQVIKALKYIHSAGVIKRNLKPSHILLNSECKVKLDDFSLAKEVYTLDDWNNVTDYNASRWYRAPEMLLAAPSYSQAVDMWSLGCILGEMLIGKTVFPGTCTINQLSLIIQLTGFPCVEEMEDIKGSLSGLLGNIKTKTVKSFENVFVNAGKEAIDLLKKLLQFSPKKRISAEEALAHPYFAEFRVPEEETSFEGRLQIEIDDKLREEVIKYKGANCKETEDGNAFTRTNTASK